MNILKFKNTTVFFDIGGPPNKGFSRKYQSGPLSFEYYLNEKKIITNCGFGYNISAKAELLSRLTSAQSTLALNNTSITRFERNKLINKIFGNSIKNSFNIFDLKFFEDEKQIKSTGSHNGYEKNFRCTHKREIAINKFSNDLLGFDKLIKKQDISLPNVFLRFKL